MVISAIDLFCGTGGLSLGLKQGGVQVVAGIDVEGSCAWPYEHNIGAKFVHQSVTDVTPDELMNLWGSTETRLLAGCAPCQPFSSQRRGKDTSGEKSWPLLLEFLRLVQGTKPDYVTMENVPRLQKSPIFRQFVDGLQKTGYMIHYKVLYGPDYGLSQGRHRLVLVAGLGNDPGMPSPTTDKGHYHTVRDAIGDLPPVKAGERTPGDTLHFARSLSAINLRRAHASKPGGTWRDWPEELRLPCQRRASGASFRSYYGRMRWDAVSPTMTTQFYNLGAGRFLHPVQDRALTPREAARLQGFPDDFQFFEPHTQPSLLGVGRLIGNAVPPVFGKAIAQQLMKSSREKARKNDRGK